ADSRQQSRYRAPDNMRRTALTGTPQSGPRSGQGTGRMLGAMQNVSLIPPASTVERPTLDTPTVEIVIPVYNEEADLEQSVRRLHRYLEEEFPFSFQITIADNASRDRTWGI